MLLEVRTYTAAPNRLKPLLARFEQDTLGLFKRHGMRASPIYTTVLGPNSNQLKYFLEWDTAEQRERCWQAFKDDADWHAAVARSEADGSLIDHIEIELLSAAPYPVQE